MNIKILEEKDNTLLKRKEFSIEIESPDKTPSNEELKKQLTSKLNTKENLISIKNINQIFGKKTSKALVYAYKDEKSLKEIEPKGKKTKKEGEAPAEQKPAEPQPEKPPEQKQEEKPQVEPKKAPKEENK